MLWVVQPLAGGCLVKHVTLSQSMDGRAEPAIHTAFGLRFSWPSGGLVFHVPGALESLRQNVETNNNLVAKACPTQ